MSTHSHTSNPCTICGFPLTGKAAEEFLMKQKRPTYEGDQTPAERLRNLLSPVMFLLDMLEMKKKKITTELIFMLLGPLMNISIKLLK